MRNRLDRSAIGTLGLTFGLPMDSQRGGQVGAHGLVDVGHSQHRLLLEGPSRDLLPWQTLYKYFRWWPEDGTWQWIHDTLRPMVRETEGRNPKPSAAIIDSQRVRATEKGCLAATMPTRRCRDANGISW